MKNKIYAIISIILLSLFFSNSFVCFARNSREYITETGFSNVDEDENEDDEEETDDTEESDENESDSATEPSSESQGSEIGPTVDEDEEPGGVAISPLFETIGGDSFWIGWRKHHYGYSPQPTTYKSQEVTYKYRIIRNGVRSYETSTAVANGYGIYNMDYSKHMVGFLNYAMSNYNQTYDVPFVDKTGVEYTGDSEPTEDPMPVIEAIEKAMNKVITTWYAKDYEEGTSYLQSFKADGFRKFWTVSFTNEHEPDLRRIQNEFFKNVYASAALTKLNSFINKFDREYRPAIRGVIFSIMESRFRNKNLQGKKNLRLKVEEKELWPFYVYCEKDNSGRIVWPENDGDYKGIDKVIDGAYQWMYYYDTKFKSSSHSTLTSFMLANETQEEASEADWEMEYEELTNRPFPYLYGDELQAFYDRITKVRSMFTESADNAEGMFGAEEIYNNTSSFSFSNAMVNMQNAMFDFCQGTDIARVWTGLTAENAARSYLLAKNIVENERVDSEYAYYNIGTNIMTYSAGRQDSSILLKDLQRVKLLQSLSDPGNVDTDGDGLVDGEELNGYERVDITKFVEKMVMAELYGKEQSGVSDTEKQTIMTNFINNVRDRASERRDDNGAECHFGEEAGKLIVELYDYYSNPVIKDTDFDGLTDQEESDIYGNRSAELLNNKITGQMQTQDNQMISNAETHMDYRYFFMNNKNYYDELSTMSLMLCNAMENYDNTEINDIERLLTRIGMNENRVTREAVAGNSRVNYITATNDIEYTHNADETPIKKRVKLIVINRIIENETNNNIEHIGTSGDSGYYSNNHKVFDELAKVICNNEINSNMTIASQSVAQSTNTYWITGYNTGGAVANILSARIIDNKSSIASNRDSVGVYCYTFGAPYTVYNYEGQAINTVESKYCSIMNVINESDIYSYIMPQKLGWSRYGMTCVKQEKKYNVVTNFIHNTFFNDKSIKNDRVLVESDIETIFNGRMNTFRSSYNDNYDNKRTDEYIMHEIFKGMRDNTLDNVIQHIDKNEWTNDTTRRNNYRVFATHLKENNQAFKNARNLSVYYNISKAITPNDVTFRVNSDTTFRGYETSQDYKTAVRKMMEWYVSHVATYQHNHNNVYRGHTLLGSEEAEEYYNRYNLQDYAGTGRELTVQDVDWMNNEENQDLILYTDFGGRGLYYCQAYAERMNQTHRMVGDDCTGLVMAVIGYYAGDDLKDDEYAIDSSNNFQINNIGTPTFRWHYRRLSNWLATQGHMYLYGVNSNTTVNDLEFGDILITCDASVSGHAEFYIDSEHTWGWGMKHRTLYDDGKLGWKGRVEKNTKVISGRNVPCFYIKDKHNYYRDINGNAGLITVQDDRPYQYVLSPNPAKRNMTSIFNTGG